MSPIELVSFYQAYLPEANFALVSQQETETSSEQVWTKNGMLYIIRILDQAQQDEAPSSQVTITQEM